MYIVKVEKSVFNSIQFLNVFIVNLLLLNFLFGTLFLVNTQYFRNHSSPYSCFFFEVNNQFSIENDK